jgi:DNA-binding transcriptional regulator GbsR (MarR family)
MDEYIRYCVYYDKDDEDIVDFFPQGIDADLRNTIIAVWEQEIPRKILKTISEGDLTMQELRQRIGHSNSTLHENVKKLEEQGLIQTKIIYEGNKIRILSPVLLFVTKNAKFKTRVQKFFQGLWVDSDANTAVIAFLRENPDDFFTSEEIAARTGFSVDDVELVLSNWDSQVTRALSDFMKKRPFEKRTLYRGLPE